MDANSQLNRFRTGVRSLLIGAFFILLWLPVVDSICNLDKSPIPNEKRNLAPFPTFSPSVKGIHDFLSGLDTYYSDHFGFRKKLIGLEHRWKHDWFKESPVSDVIVGRDGWLYYGVGDMIAQCRGVKSFSDDELRRWQTLLERRRDWLAKRGIKYLFVIPPDKQTIYPEKLPDWLNRTGPYNRLDQFFGYMKAHSTVEVLDLRPCLFEAKNSATLYLSTDTHWNFLGSFIGYQTLMRTMGKQLPDLEPLPISAFDQQPGPTKGGDLAEMLDQEQTVLEKCSVTLVPRPPLEVLQVYTNTTLLPKKETKNFVPVYTDNPNQKYKILVFRDSFSNGWRRCLGYNFKHALFVWQYDWNADLIEREHPDIVLDEMLERFFYTTDPNTLLRADALK